MCKIIVNKITVNISSCSRTVSNTFIQLKKKHFIVSHITQLLKTGMSIMEKETSKPNDVAKFEMIREHNKNKTEAKWKYKVRSLHLQCKDTIVMNNLV